MNCCVDPAPTPTTAPAVFAEAWSNGVRLQWSTVVWICEHMAAPTSPRLAAATNRSPSRDHPPTLPILPADSLTILLI